MHGDLKYKELAGSGLTTDKPQPSRGCPPLTFKVGSEKAAAIFELTELLIGRFWADCDRGDSRTCWNWCGHKNSQGYGSIRADYGRNSRLLKAHRVSLQIHSGTQVPDNLDVLHRCDNRACVNPEHLFLGTALDNVRDMFSKGRAAKRSALSELDRRIIVRLDGVLPRTSIASLFGVSRRTVYSICTTFLGERGRTGEF